MAISVFVPFFGRASPLEAYHGGYSAYRPPAFRANTALFPRALAEVLATIAWPPAVLIHLWQIRRLHGPEAVPIKRVPGALWAARRHNILPSEFYGYALWRPDRRANIDDYLYCNEAARLFKVINRPFQPEQHDPLTDKLAFSAKASGSSW